MKIRSFILCILVVLFFSLPIQAADPVTGHQTESAWVPITLILTCVVVAVLAHAGGNTDTSNTVNIQENRSEVTNEKQ